MADYAISNVPRRVVYAASGTGPYAFTFEILAASDVAVYKGDTLLTLTTDYTVTINANGTGSVTLVTTAGTSQITIVGAKNIQRTTDFTTGGDLFANTLNDELDNQTIYVQQVAETAERGLKAPVTDPTDINMTLPRKASRAGKILAFDANGNPTVGEDIGNWRSDWASGTAYTVRDLVRDASNLNIYRCNTAHTSSGTTPISTNADSAKWDVVIAVADISDLADAAADSAADSAASAILANDWATKTSGTVAGGEYSAKYHANAASGYATTASGHATDASNSASAAAGSASSAAASYDSFDDRYLGAKISNPTVDNDGNALLTGAIYFNSVASTMRVWNGSSWQDQAASPDTMVERSFSATAGQTSYTFTGGYRVGYTYVWVNGSMLASADITATNGTTITFTNALSLDDEVRILSFKAIGTVAIGDISGLQTALDAKESNTNRTTSVISTNTNAVSGRTYILTASLTLTLPSSPTAGDYIGFANRSGTTTASIARNGSNIMGAAEDLTLDSAQARARLIYTGATQGWVIVNG